MTAEYFYTLDLGAVYGEKLETLAAYSGDNDVEAFAAMLLRGAIDQLHQDMVADLDRAEKEANTPKGGGRGGGTDMDDGIPF